MSHTSTSGVLRPKNLPKITAHTPVELPSNPEPHMHVTAEEVPVACLSPKTPLSAPVSYQKPPVFLHLLK